MLRLSTAIACCLLAMPAVALELDPGGVAFEWPPAGGPVVQRELTGGNLAQGGDFETPWEQMGGLGWAAGTWTGGPTREPYPGSAHNGVAEGQGREGSRGFRLTVDPGSHRVISSYARVIVPLEGARGLRVRLWHRAGDPPSPPGSASVNVRPMTAEGSSLAGTERFFNAGSDWRQADLDFLMPPGAAQAYVQIVQRGPGEVLLDDVQCLRFEPDPELRVAPCVMGRLDGVVGLAPGDLYVARLLLTNESGLRVTEPALELDLPEGIECVPANAQLAAGCSSGPSERDGCVLHSQRFPWLSVYTGAVDPYGMRFRVCLRASLQPTGTDLQAWVRVRGSDYTGPWCPLTIRVLPAIEPVTPPRRLLIGGSFDADLDGEAAAAFLRSYRRWGANLASVRTMPPDDFRNLLRESDLYVTLDNRTWQNAHGVLNFQRGEGPVPEEALWIGADGKPDTGILVCPEYIAGRGERFLAKVMPELRRAFIEDTVFDAWATNWEPQVHYSRGCFCTRCRTAFAAFVGEPEATIAGMTADEIMTTYKERWQQFRAGQSARLVRLALDVFEELSAERGEDIPCLLWCGHAIFTDQGGRDGMSEHLREAPGVGSWAYAGWLVEAGKWSYSDPFYEETGRTIAPDLCHLLTAQAAEEIARRIPQLTGRGDFKYVHAVMGHYFTDYFSTPEEGTLDLLAAAIARPWAIRPPYFP
ncbi:MAG TPA: hypothetical protein VM283_09895, partial [Armatimonadota bacterium]|nr:hypothetical protein [Armatimonadota bacterium]